MRRKVDHLLAVVARPPRETSRKPFMSMAMMPWTNSRQAYVRCLPT